MTATGTGPGPQLGPTGLPAETQAAAMDRYGGPEVLRLRTLAVPPVAADEVLLRVHTAGVGPWDVSAREGRHVPEGAQFPFVPGVEASGWVLAAGGGITHVAPGDEVFAFAYSRPHNGCYSRYVVLKGEHVTPLPAGMPLDQGSCAGALGMTALAGLNSVGLAAGGTLLVVGASGGVGHVAVQLAKRMQLRVIGIASGADGVDLVDRLGADLTLDGRGDAAEVTTSVRRAAPDGVDAVLALTSADILEQLLTVLRPGGVLAYPNGVKQLSAAPQGVTVQTFSAQISRDLIARLTQLIEAGPFTVQIADRFPLGRAGDAQQRLDSHHVGAIVLSLGDP